MYNLPMVHNATVEAVEAVEAVLGVCFFVVHKKAAISYLEYNPESGSVSFLDNFDEEDQGTKSQKVIAEDLLDLSILDKKLEIHRGACQMTDTLTATTMTCPGPSCTQRRARARSWV